MFNSLSDRLQDTFERLRGKTDGLRARFAHLCQLIVEQGKLLVKFTSHYPNLPVM